MNKIKLIFDIINYEGVNNIDERRISNYLKTLRENKNEVKNIINKEYEDLSFKFHKMEKWERDEISRLIEKYTKGNSYYWYISHIISEILKEDEIKTSNERIKMNIQKN